MTVDAKNGVPGPGLFEQAPDVTADAGNNLWKSVGEGVQAMGDMLIDLLDRALTKVTGAVAGGVAALGSGEPSFSTGRTENPYKDGYVAAAPITPGRGQAITAPSTEVAISQSKDMGPEHGAPDRGRGYEEINEAVALGNLPSPMPNRHKLQELGEGLGRTSNA